MHQLEVIPAQAAVAILLIAPKIKLSNQLQKLEKKKILKIIKKN